MKIHVPCGDIYLKDYLNCDITGVLVNGYHPSTLKETSLGEYYKDRQVGNKKMTYIDRRMNMLDFPWSFADECADEVVMIQGIEHFSLADAGRIVKQVHRILKPGGRFLVDFPDVEEAVLEYIHSDPEFCMRLLYCNHKNEYSVHHWGYTRETFLDLLGAEWDVKFVQVVEHSYPTIGCQAVKK
jgi:predicted SAM-dependent methyltransferase